MQDNEVIPVRHPDVPPKKTTAPLELVFLAIIVVGVVIMVLVIILVLKPKLFSGQVAAPVPGGIPASNTCPTSPGPTNLTATVQDVSVASFEAKWDPILTATTPNVQILGYNIYVSTTPGITLQNTTSSGFTVPPQMKVLKSSSGALVFGQKYYFKVQTVDQCGAGDLSSQETSITI